MTPRHPSRRERGFSLSEALISLTVLTSGLLALAQFQGDLHENRLSTKAQTSAANLALEKLEELRHQATIDAATLMDGRDRPAASAGEHATFERRWTITPHRDPSFTEIEVVTDWQAPDGAPHSSGVCSFITASRPYGEQNAARADAIAVEEEVSLDSQETEAPSPETASRQNARSEPPAEPQSSATCLCVRETGAARAALDPRSQDPACSSACCETTWLNAHDGDCERESCAFVAQCASG